MFFRNQIIAPLLFNSAPLHYFFLPSVHVESLAAAILSKNNVRKEGRIFFFSHDSAGLSGPT